MLYHICIVVQIYLWNVLEDDVLEKSPEEDREIWSVVWSISSMKTEWEFLQSGIYSAWRKEGSRETFQYWKGGKGKMGRDSVKECSDRTGETALNQKKGDLD